MSRSLFRDKRRMRQLIQYWTSKPSMSSLGLVGFIQAILYEPIRLVIEINNLHFFKHEVFEIPLRYLTKRELTHLHALLLQHKRAAQPIFATMINIANFSITYHKFKYNTLMSQYFDRLAFVRCFVNTCMSLIGSKRQAVEVKSACHSLLQKERMQMKQSKHPLRRRLAVLVATIERQETWCHEEK